MSDSERGPSKNEPAMALLLQPGDNYLAMWAVFIICVAGYAVILGGSLILGTFNEGALWAGLVFAGLAGLSALGIRYYRVDRVLVVDTEGVLFFRGERLQKALAWSAIRQVTFGHGVIETRYGDFLQFRRRGGVHGISADTVHYRISYEFDAVAALALRMARNHGIRTKIKGRPEPETAARPSEIPTWVRSKAERKARRKVYRRLGVRMDFEEGATADPVIPVSWAQRRGVRAFRRMFGPRHPGYFLGAFFFLMFAIPMVLLGQPWAYSDSAFLGTFLLAGLGSFFLFAWFMLPTPPFRSRRLFYVRFSLSMALGIVGIGALFGSFLFWGRQGFISMGAAMFLALVAISLAAFVRGRFLECRFCGGFTHFRKRAGRWLCTRCETAAEADPA